MRLEELVCFPFLFEFRAQELHRQIFEVLSVFVIDKSIMENSLAFMQPQSGEDLRIHNGLGLCHQDTLDNAADVSQIE